MSRSIGLVKRAAAGFALVCAVSIVAVPVPTQAAASWTVAAKGLDNPHGIGFTADGALIVTQTGPLGNVCVVIGCVGLNSRITSIDLATGDRTKLVGGLLSLGFLPIETFGLGGVSVQGDRVFVVTAENPRFVHQLSRLCTTQKCTDTTQTIKDQAGLLIEVDQQGGGSSTVAEVGRYDYRWVVHNDPSPGNPDFAPGDADPYGLLALPEGTYIADGGSNTLSFVDDTGAVSVLAYIPDPPKHKPLYDAVPTCVAQAGGAIYVGTLTGSLYEWQNDELTQVLHGGDLRAISGCTSDADGNLYLVNLTKRFNHFNPMPGSGSVVKVAPDLTTSYVISPDEGLNYPNGIAFGPDGALYVTANSICPADPRSAGVPKGYCPRAGGEVIKVTTG